LPRRWWSCASISRPSGDRQQCPAPPSESGPPLWLGFFFNPGPSAAGATAAAVVLRGLVELHQPQPDSGAAEASDRREVGGAAAAVLPSQEGDEQPARLLIEGGDQPIDVAVLLGEIALGLFLAGRAATAVRLTREFLGHQSVPPWARSRRYAQFSRYDQVVCRRPLTVPLVCSIQLPHHCLPEDRPSARRFPGLVQNTTVTRGVISVNPEFAPEFLFYAPPPSRQSEAVAEVARRVHSSLRLDLLEKIAPSDLWLRTCCILRRDRSSQG